MPDDDLDPDVLLAAVIEPVAENQPGDDADVIELRRSEARRLATKGWLSCLCRTA